MIENFRPFLLIGLIILIISFGFLILQNSANSELNQTLFEQQKHRQQVYLNYLSNDIQKDFELIEHELEDVALEYLEQKEINQNTLDSMSESFRDMGTITEIFSLYIADSKISLQLELKTV